METLYEGEIAMLLKLHSVFFVIVNTNFADTEFQIQFCCQTQFGATYLKATMKNCHQNVKGMLNNSDDKH